MIKTLIVSAGALGLMGGFLVAGGVPAAGADEPDVTVARGLIVRADSGIGPQAATRAAMRAATGTTEQPAALAPDTTVVDFEQPLPLAEAQRIATEVAGRPGIAWAEPDVLLTPATEEFPNDPLFDEQWYLWDFDAAEGGYSVRAPSVWGATTGDDSVVVAVIDTGVTDHPDLAGTVIAGYDFVSNIPMANDGDSWDPNPADPGDWFDEADRVSGLFPDTCVLANSSWHGTHVAGIAAAVQNNEYGISGAAPGLTVLNVRALGKCGGFLSDIAAAVRWSVGDVVLDRNTGIPLPVNPAPANVINLSLGGIAPCSAAMSEAIVIAESRGAVVVAAAGNDASPISEYVPANCAGVVSVVATDRNAARATYSNYGTQDAPASIAAPGGGSITAILATDNTGTKAPDQPSFGTKRGTSMATPIVSAAAGLLYSLGLEKPTQVRSRLLEAVQEFPTDVPSACTAITCGAGLLDYGQLADSITIIGERGIVRGRPGILVDGVTVGLPEGTAMTPYVKFAGETSYTEGIARRYVSIVEGIRGEFFWQRRTGKKIYVYFRSETGERSNRVIIPAK